MPRSGVYLALCLMSTFRRLAILYLSAVILSAGVAFYLDTSLLHSTRGDVFPDLPSFVVALPSSLSISVMYITWPDFFSKPFAQTSWITFCGLAQATLLFALTRRRPPGPNHSSKRTRSNPSA